MDGRPKRQSAADKDYRERKRLRKDVETSDKAAKASENNNELALCKQLYKDIKDTRDPDDESRLLSSFFAQLPSKRQYPDYYDIIKQPIALSTIKSKIDHNEYSTLADMKADIELMVSNAKKYNMKDSLVYQDAVKIQKLSKAWKPDGTHKGTTDAKNRESSASVSPSEKKGKNVLKLPGGAFGANAKTTPPPPPPQQQQQQQPPAQESKVKAIRLKAVEKQNKKGLQNVMDAICNKETKKAIELLESDDTIDPNGLVEVEMFNDKFKWGPLHAAAYYGDTKVIHTLMKRGADIELNDTWYSGTPLSWAAFGEHDKVARILIEQYNADRDARNKEGQVPFDLVSAPDDPRWVGVLKGPFPPKAKPSPDQQEQKRLVTSVSIPASRKAEELGDTPELPKKKRGRPPKAEKETLEALNRPVNEVDLAEFDQVAYMKELFHAIRVHTDNTGRLYSEIFEELPDREEYPDYYKTIKKPLSLGVIEDNMINRRYPTLGDWFNDMKLMFDNAMEYNEPGSRVYKDAKLLLRLLYRLKDRNLAREGVPESQEPEVMQLSLADRPYDTDEKRKPKRPPPRPKPQTGETVVDITSTPATVPQTAMRPNYGMPPAPIIPPSTHPIILQGFMQPQAFPNHDYSVPENLLNETIVHGPQANGNAQQVITASPAFFEEFNVDLRQLRPLCGIRLESIGNGEKMTLGGDLIGHSFSVASNVETIKIMPILKDVLRSESRRLSVVVLQNNTKLNMAEGDLESAENPPCWISGPLMRGLNTFKITISANLTKSDMPMGAIPDYKTQVYFLFISRP